MTNKQQLITARELGEMLIRHDPDGAMPVSFVVNNPGGDTVALGEIGGSELDVCIKHAQRLENGTDRDIVRVQLVLWSDLFPD